ncbi:MAG: hypothetical protein IIY82_04230, partial [Firmicutes bacterium]|nr:hypothetical protein [Bacillota bacterium]
IRYYNEKRSKASLGYRSPVEYRKDMLAAYKNSDDLSPEQKSNFWGSPHFPGRFVLRRGNVSTIKRL